jgi:gamma-glutamyl-gamma-aminobutyrate hydrolase PuuD
MPPRKQIVQPEVQPAVAVPTKTESVKTVFIVYPDSSYTSMFQEEGWRVTRDPIEATLIQFTGGADVAPELYGETPHWSTLTNVNRDTMEVALFTEALKLGKNFAGICRGGQLLCVLSGDRMWQNVNHHGLSGVHSVRCRLTGEQYLVSSTHHQMMRLREGSKAEVLATTERADLKETATTVQHGLDPEGDLEAVWYAETRALCFQPHPEYFTRGHSCRELYFNYLEKKFGYPR